MNCPDFEDRIALYAGADLPDGDAADVERHLAQCPECATFAEEMRESQVSLKLLSNSAPGSVVRARVMEALDRRPGRMPWVAAAATACVVIAAGLVWRLQQQPNLEALLPIAPVVSVPAPSAPPPRVVPAIRQRKPKPKPERVLLARNTEPLVVKMLTDDPDVVIIWLVDGKEQNDEEAPLGFDGTRGE